MTKTYIMNGLVEKMQSPDQDFRYMGLSDLMKEVNQDAQSFLGDETTENKVLNQVLKLVEDVISEVKNQAVKCLGQLIKIIREQQMESVIDRLVVLFSSKDEELRDISGLALKTITSELPSSGALAPKACAKLTPQLLRHLSDANTSPEALIETLSILSILVTDFPSFISNLELDPPPLTVIPPLLSHSRAAIRKRAIQTLSLCVPLASVELFENLLSSEIRPNLMSSAIVEKQRTTVNLVASIARVTPQRLTQSLPEIVPGILKALERDDDELREVSLQALETLSLKCPSEVTPYLSAIIQAANQYVKYDPNYAGGDDDDEEMGDAEDPEDAELDEYSDDEDTSYKIRRSATKLHAAIIATRPELLVMLYRDVSPILLSRFGDREETVRLDVWSTYVVLLNQTRVYGSATQVKDGVGYKRKRSPDYMDIEETALSLLQSQVPSLSKALLNQLKLSRTSPTVLQAGFGVLCTLLDVLPGCLSSQATAISAISNSVLSHSLSTSSSSLHLACLQFLALFFSSHSPPTYSNSLPNLTPLLLVSLTERHPRISAESFRVFSSLLNSMKPVKGQDWVEHVYAEALKRLSNHETDAEIRMRAEEVIADLWICSFDTVKMQDRKEWTYICRTTGRIDGSVKVVSRVAQEVDVGSDWVHSCVEWSTTMLRKAGRTGKVELFECLSNLLMRYDPLPAEIPPSLVPDLKSYISTTDIALLSQALSLLALMLQLSPTATFPEVEKDALPNIYNIAYSPLVSGMALESMLSFFSALIEADGQIATHVVPSLVKATERAPTAADASLGNVAKCIAQVVKSAPAVTAGVVAEFSKHIKAAAKSTVAQVVLSLLVIGEIGRFVDMTPNRDVFVQSIELFGADQENIRVAAAFTAGNIAIGNLHQFLPSLVKLIQGDNQRRLLGLQALKEVATHTSIGQLEHYAETLWGPLFESSEGADESSQNVAAACLGKLITTNPLRYLPQVHSRISDPNTFVRSTALAAIRYTFADSSQSYDEVLAPYLLDFLSLMSDSDMNVRRLALSALNACAKTKPHLIREHLPVLIPKLYEETALKSDLIRIVQMGPWQHKVDDGLDARKTAYETLYTLLDTCLTKIDLNEFIKHVLTGLSDPSDEIKVICHMMLFRLSQIASTAVIQHLAEATPVLENSMKGRAVNKDTVKQDLERAAELQRSTLRAIAALSKITPPGIVPKFDNLVADIKRSTEWSNEFRELLG